MRDVKSVIKTHIRQGEPRPTELIDWMIPPPEFRLAQIQDALSEMLDNGEIELTPDRRLIIKHDA